MVHKVPVKFVSYLPLNKSAYEPKGFYSLFKLVDGRWNQVRTNSYPIEGAVKVWGDIVCANPNSFSIRKAAFDYHEAR